MPSFVHEPSDWYAPAGLIPPTATRRVPPDHKATGGYAVRRLTPLRTGIPDGGKMLFCGSFAVFFVYVCINA